MELNEQPFAPTLAQKLGDGPHVSRLLRRITQLSGAGERVADWLLTVASLPADLPALSDKNRRSSFLSWQRCRVRL
jgi:hypothetical protein